MSVSYIEPSPKLMSKILPILILLSITPVCLQAQKYMKPLTAHQRNLKGAVHTVEYNCISSAGNDKSSEFFEYSRNGKETRGLQLILPVCMIGPPVTSKATNRNSRGDIEEFSIFF
jgi:hypothetical protein